MNKLLILIIAVSVASCKKAAEETYSVDTTAEAGQQVGDAMAAIDESGGTTNGSISKIEFQANQRAFARLAPYEISTTQALLNHFVSKAEAVSCSAVGFSGCTSNQRVRNFEGCSTYAGGTMSGNVTLNFSGSGASSCTIPAANDAASRVPNFSITGLRGATFAVAATSTGQSLTRTGATTFNFTNAGIRRSFVTPKGETILDITTATGSAIQVTGNNRANRTVNGGSLVVTNNISGVSCTLTPTSVQWSSGCNCPTAGQWTGSCSDSSQFTVAFGNSCGEATVTKGSGSSTIILDRCQ
jgi:hypothetical protein